MTTPPILFLFDEIATADGELVRVMVPIRAHLRIADEHYDLGDRYPLAPVEDRSMRSHNHYFACIANAWMNLPEDMAEQYPNAERLRKHALIRTGYRDERSFVCSSKAEALRLASFLLPCDPDAIVSVHETAVVELKAKSQSLRAMGKKEFQESKDAVLGWLSNKIGVDVTTLRKNAAA